MVWEWFTTADDQTGWNMNTSCGADFYTLKTVCEADSEDSVCACVCVHVCACVFIFQESVLFVLLINKAFLLIALPTLR